MLAIICKISVLEKSNFALNIVVRRHIILRRRNRIRRISEKFNLKFLSDPQIFSVLETNVE